MVKKLKALAGEGTAPSTGAASVADHQLVSTVKDSAQQIWLAGLGAFAKAQEEGSKVFDALVKEGETMHKKTRKLAEDKLSATVSDVTGQVQAFAAKAQGQATAGWDKLEQVFEDRVARALNGLGVPTNKDIQALTRRVEELTASVNALAGGSKPKAVRVAVPTVAAAVAKKAPAKKVAAKVAKKAAAK
jgi:poly(hydroxyalkanoate) granule-associated protein